GGSHRIGAVLVDEADQLAADLAEEHHAHVLHDLRRGDAEAAAELPFQADFVEHHVDLRPAAMHDDGARADRAEEDHVGGEGSLELVVNHGVAAVLHNHDFVAVVQQPWQGLGQHVGTLRGGQPAGAGGVVNLRHGESLGYRWRLARVLGVDLDVGVGQVGGPDGGLAVAAGEVDLDVDVLTREVHLAGVRGSGGVDADVVAVEGHSDLRRVHGYRGHADGGEHAAPVRVGAEHRALEEVVATDDAGGGLGLLVGGGAGDGDRDLLGHALGVALQLAGEVQADLVDRAGEIGGVRLHTGGTVGEHDEGVVGGGGAVHVDAVEGDPAGCPQRLLGGLCAGQLGVGGEEDQHRGQGWGHHAHALGHRADAPAIALVDRLLDDGIRGHDRLGGLGAGLEVGGELGGQCLDSRLDLVHRQQVAD